MISIKINGKKYTRFESYSIDLRFDAIASSFSFVASFDPENSDHKSIFKPFSYPEVKVYHNDELLITGVIVSYSFTVSDKPALASFSGYSKTGVLEDSTISQESYPLDYKKVSVVDIAKKLCSPFEIGVKVDSSVIDKANEVIANESAKESQTVKNYLAGLCNQRNIVLTHDASGNVLMTKAVDPEQPVDSYNENIFNAQFVCNGQKMFSETLVLKQAGVSSDNAGQSVIANPFVSTKRTTTFLQSSGDNNDSDTVANNVLSKQLKEGISFSFNTVNQTFRNGSLIKPNNTILVKSEDLYLYSYTKLFIEKVTLKGDGKNESASINCVIPEVYTKETPINFFK